MFPKSGRIAALVLATTSLGCQPPDLAEVIERQDLPLEVWDFSEGLLVEGARWGAEGWETSAEIADEQYKSPVYLRILLPDDRWIEGKFSFVRAIRDGDLVTFVSLESPPLSPEAGFERARQTILTAGAPDKREEGISRLADWLQGGPEPAEHNDLHLHLYPLDEPGMKVGLSTSWDTWSMDSVGTWQITVAIMDYPGRLPAGPTP